MAIPRRYQLLAFPTVLLLLSFIFIVKQYQYQLRNTLSYATRPLWDTDDQPKVIVPHYQAEALSPNLEMCALHGWKFRDFTEQRQMIIVDAVLMSSEIDLLEIRMNELFVAVDWFFIVESNRTFTGLPKPTYFADNRARFARFERKIVYEFLPGREPGPGQSAWDIENYTRISMTHLIREQVATFQSGAKTMVIMADVDEIPSSNTIELLKACEFGSSIHLQMRNYLYSFEWYIGLSSWRASVHIWDPVSSYYRHSKSIDTMLADAGWHCSYCFRTIPEYIVKMKGFSHSDRIGGDMSLLDPKRIQETICKGKDIFGMLPEAYSWVDLLSKMSLEPSTSAVGLPRFLILNADRFKFLLPRGCKREA